MRKIDLRWNSLQTRDGGAICGTSCGLQKGVKWFARFIVSRGWWRTLARNHFFSITLQESTCFRAHNGPVDESMIAARKSGRDAGNRICASTLPAPAD